jgi:hypothetical protein
MKSSTKTKASKIQQHRKATGGEAALDLTLNATELRIRDWRNQYFGT